MFRTWMCSGSGVERRMSVVGERLAKLEVARRQLVTAIRLFFDEADSVSVYTLAQAASEVLDALCQHSGTIRFRSEMAKATGHSERQIKAIAEFGKNFFKHADRDPEAELEQFTDDLNDHILMMATFDFGELSPVKPVEVQVFQVWYFAVYPEKLPQEFNSLRIAAAESFPAILTTDRAGRKAAGLSVLKQSRVHPEIMRDPGTDMKPVAHIVR